MRIMISQGETLLNSLQRANIEIDAPCNGNGTCGMCDVMVYGYGKVKSCQFNRPGTYEVTIPMRREFTTVMSESDSHLRADKKRKARYQAAVDIGTTTVAGSVYDESGQECNQFSFVNPQRKFGADVMSRMKAANEGHLEELQTLITEQLNKYIRDCEHVVVSANTTMNHLLQGLSCKGLGQTPFVPVNISLHRYGNMEILPSISTFVGGDIVSGIYALDIIQSEKVILLVDLGTNGEMALGNRDRLIVASTAAGPAFEGNELALQIHGSGIMRVLHEMLKQGAMDESGLMSDEFFQSGYPIENMKYVSNENADGTYVANKEREHQDMPRMTQDIVREVQMAKAAIYAGIEILLKNYGIAAEAVDKIYLAGGMGYYLNPEDAFAIGLLPEEFAGKVVAVGNSSLKGAIRLLGEENEILDKNEKPNKKEDNWISDYEIREDETREKLTRITSLAEEIVLADHPQFEEFYIEAMNFQTRM